MRHQIRGPTVRVPPRLRCELQLLCISVRYCGPQRAVGRDTGLNSAIAILPPDTVLTLALWAGAALAAKINGWSAMSSKSGSGPTWKKWRHGS